MLATSLDRPWPEERLRVLWWVCPPTLAVAWQGHYNPRPFIIAITLAASLSFVTPIGYQSNLMVMGPGGYRPVDFLRCGIPLAIVVTITALALIPNIWPLGAN